MTGTNRGDGGEAAASAAARASRRATRPRVFRIARRAVFRLGCALWISLALAAARSLWAGNFVELRLGWHENGEGDERAYYVHSADGFIGVARGLYIWGSGDDAPPFEWSISFRPTSTNAWTPDGDNVDPLLFTTTFDNGIAHEIRSLRRANEAYTIWRVRYWAVLTPLGLALSWPGVMALLRARRARQRRAGNRCVACGYDLRATTGRCPECGRLSRASASG